MKKYTIIGGVMTLLLVCTFIIAGSTYASNSNKNNGQGPKIEMTEEMKAIREQMDTAIQNNDYETWKTLVSEMPNGPDGSKIDVTEENFANIVAKYNERVANDALREQVKTAIENSDYATWQSLISQLPNGTDMLAKIATEESFLKLVEAHKLIEEGKAKIEEGHAIMEELGLPKEPKPPFGDGRGMNMGMGKMMGKFGHGEQPQEQE